MIEVASKHLGTSRGAYMQYRPVSYTSMDRLIANSTDINQSFIFNLTNGWEKANNSIAYRFYNFSLHNNFISEMNVSFGAPGDGFYKNRNYTTWYVIQNGNIFVNF